MKRAGYERRRYRARKDERVCVDCPADTDGQHVRCFNCRRKRADRMARLRAHKQEAA